ncbi:sigma-54 interaction domain-containing protein [Salibacterium sp. K-3]
MYKTPYFHLPETGELIDLLTSIFDTSNDGLYVCDKNGFTMLYNEAFLQISGIPKDFMDAYSTMELHQMNVVPESCAGTAIQSRQPHSTIIDYYNGKKGVVSATPIFDEEHDILFVVSYIRDITEINRLHKELEETRQINIQFRKTLEEIQNSSKKGHNFVYRSKHMEEIISTAAKLAKNDSPMLLLGESGVGKDVLAHYIHDKSNRKGQLIKINCGAIPEHLLESELFGYEKGAFTGAATSKEGLFETADDGTLFLDEIGDLPYSLQVKLLNVLQDSKIRRLGATQTREVNVRIITATNTELESLVEQKTFRLDLYYRLNVLSITIPPLRDRQEDIPALIFSYLKKLSNKYKVEKRISNEALEKCLEYSWPGNGREVENIVERTYHMCENTIITVEDLPSFIQHTETETFTEHESPVFHAGPSMSLKTAVSDFEKNYIFSVLSQSSTLQECADTLGIHISTLVRKKKRWET